MGRPQDEDAHSMTEQELAEDADRAMHRHLAELAAAARARYGTMTPARVEEFLQDPHCVRRPHRIVFEHGEMAPHQFAQPSPATAGGRHVLWVHPMLRDRPQLLPLAVAYLVPVINYGDGFVGDEHCIAYAARLLDRGEDEVYRDLCDLADELALEARSRGE